MGGLLVGADVVLADGGADDESGEEGQEKWQGDPPSGIGYLLIYDRTRPNRTFPEWT
jgi:hypothetical protein